MADENTKYNVLFKRGKLASLPSSSANVSVGTFYLTTDTNRLYVGQDGGKLLLLNQTINIVSTTNNLASATQAWVNNGEEADHVQDFAYIQLGNILAAYIKDTEDNQYKWKQINADNNTVIISNEYEISSANNTASVLNRITDDGEQNSTHTATFGIAGAGGINVSSNSSTNVITLTGDTYTLGATVTAGDLATITLSSANTSTTSGFVIHGGENVSVTATGGYVEITSKDTQINSIDLSVNNGTLGIDIVDTDGGHSTTATVPAGIILDDGTYAPLADTSSNSNGLGGIYSKDQIDGFFNGLNGMEYKGVITSSGSGLPTSGVSIGDVYLVGDNGLVATTSTNGVFVGSAKISDLGEVAVNGIRVGDMFIAKGTEDTDASNTATYGTIISNLTWSYVPSGNEASDQFIYRAEATADNNLILLKDSQSAGAQLTVMSVQLSAGSGIAISSTSPNSESLQTTISHGPVTTTATTSNAASTTAFSAISSISYDSFGHITAVNTETFTPPVYDFADTTSTHAVVSYVDTLLAVTANNSGHSLVNFATNLKEDDSVVASSVTKLSSDSIILSTSATTGEIIMNLEWGTF